MLGIIFFYKDKVYACITSYFLLHRSTIVVPRYPATQRSRLAPARLLNLDFEVPPAMLRGWQVVILALLSQLCLGFTKQRLTLNTRPLDHKHPRYQTRRAVALTAASSTSSGIIENVN